MLPIKSNSDENYLFVKADYQIQRIDFEDILYIEGLKDYVKLYVVGSSKPLVFHATMKSLEEKLPIDSFMRIHRSYIVSLNKIKTIERDHIILVKTVFLSANKTKRPLMILLKTSFSSLFSWI